MKTKNKITAIVFAAMLIFSALMLIGAQGLAEESLSDGFVAELTAKEDTLPLIDESGKSDYNIIFSSDAIQLDYSLSKEIQTLFAEKGVLTVGINPDSYVPEHATHEILIGMTDRAESEELLAKLEEACENSDDIAWGYAVINEKLLFVANSTLGFELGQDGFIEYLTECELAPAKDLLVTEVKTMAEYEAELEEAARLEKEQKLKALIEMNEAFEDSQFNTDLHTPGNFYKPMAGEGGHFPNGSSKGKPWAYPAEGEHPRYLITEKNIDKIKEILLAGEDPDSDYATLAKEFWAKANTDMESIYYGVFQDQYKSTGGNS